MRLSKVRLSGFKSFVDPTSVQLPGNLTGVVGPNGCGKSNIIDAVRWVMGELSARHLRGDSMADVIFNGSSSRKPVGAASVELVFDNSDGKIGGAYASYTEVSLKRVVARDGSSSYFINGGRCRRKDITQLFLGTGLGSRSYAIIEQGMISRVIEARSDDMRAFVEEAAGVSLYKERRRETESRVADARENLARLQDLRDEVDKQIRHLQRQAAAARKYQDLKAQERLLTAELLALRLRDLDSGALTQDGAMRECELAMQQALADQRGAEAAIERQRARHLEHGEVLNRVQGRYYELGAAVTRTEENIRYTRELRERQRSELAEAGSALDATAAQIAVDEQALSTLHDELRTLEPEVETLQRTEQATGAALVTAEAELAEWQRRWEEYHRDLGNAGQTAEVEGARIEQLDSQMLRLQARADRLAVERDAVGQQEAGAPLGAISDSELAARDRAEALTREQSAALAESQQLRAEQHAAEATLEGLRARREGTRAELLSLEALQQAALGASDARASGWLEARGIGGRGRATELLDVEAGWERAVETALGDYLEAVAVDSLEMLEQALQSFEGGSVAFIDTSGGVASGPSGTLAGCVRGPAAVVALLEGVRTAESLGAALRQRSTLARGESIITRGGEWLGSEWLRVNRGGDAHAGVIEREHRLKALRHATQECDAQVRAAEAAVVALRERSSDAERRRDATQAEIQSAHRQHAETRAQLEALRVRLEETAARRTRLEAEAAEVERERVRAQQSLQLARATRDAALQSLQQLDARRPDLEEERELRRESASAARARAQEAQLAMRDLLIRVESRRSARSSMAAALARLVEQRGQLEQRRTTLAEGLADGDAPIHALESQLQDALARRLTTEGELATARRQVEEAESELRSLDQRRLAAELRVNEARDAMEQARLAAQESRLRREALMEQFAATHCELEVIRANLDPAAEPAPWEARIAEVRAEVEKLGQVNLAAIDELKEQSERKTYLDRQYTDVSDALNTLEQAMRKIDRETRVRFDETFNRINQGLNDKFPRLFGGGHAYLELVGEDPLTAGVAVMARPPGKRNSTISQLSGGEKALTAVALVFSIFDLNPAPFCLLDEVDAPLDEHNVGRFCDIVREMSGRVQFIFITHNKVTMELASQLIGVTMNEPGVSRLVAVDVDEAVRLAAV
jgi:chromosome segregation protein